MDQSAQESVVKQVSVKENSKNNTSDTLKNLKITKRELTIISLSCHHRINKYSRCWKHSPMKTVVLIPMPVRSTTGCKARSARVLLYEYRA